MFEVQSLPFLFPVTHVLDEQDQLFDCRRPLGACIRLAIETTLLGSGTVTVGVTNCCGGEILRFFEVRTPKESQGALEGILGQEGLEGVRVKGVRVRGRNGNPTKIQRKTCKTKLWREGLQPPHGNQRNSNENPTEIQRKSNDSEIFRPLLP